MSTQRQLAERFMVEVEHGDCEYTDHHMVVGLLTRFQHWAATQQDEGQGGGGDGAPPIVIETNPIEL